MWAGAQARRGRPQPAAHVSAGEESSREATCVRQLLGAQGVSLRVCGAADPSQGPWVPGALRAALRLCLQATAGGALHDPFLSMAQSSSSWSPWQCTRHRTLSPTKGSQGPRFKGEAGAELRPGRRQWRLPASRSRLLPGQEARPGRAALRQQLYQIGALSRAGALPPWSEIKIVSL